jgi:acyl-CoA thioester hydrolase
MAAVELPGGKVLPDWIDWNGHMNVACYLVAFDHALDIFFEEVGIGMSRAKTDRMGPYALQTHMHFLAEMLEGEPFRFRLILLDCDARRTHYIIEMLHGGTGAVCATMEQVSMNVDLTTRRSAPYPDWAQARLEAIRAAHADLPRPPQTGQPLGIRRRATAPGTG